MSIIYRSEIVTETVTHEKQHKVGFKCDVCKKEYPLGTRYWHASSSHNDWGNDSIDSLESFDVCGPECLHKLLDEYITNCRNSCTYDFSVEQAKV